MHKVLINSLPKSGTNLLAQILDLYNFNEKGHISSGLFLSTSLFARLRNMIYRDSKYGYEIGVDMPLKIKKLYIEKILKNCSEGEYITSHFGYDEVLIDYIHKQNFKIIFVVRDPRAVINSLYNYILNNPNHPLNFHFKNMSISKRYKSLLFGLKFKDYNLNSMKNKYNILKKFIDNPNVLTIKFEDIIGTRGGGSDELMILNIQNIANFINADIYKTEFVVENFFGPGRKTFRKGNIRSWKNELPPEIIESTTNELKSTLSLWDYL